VEIPCFDRLKWFFISCYRSPPGSQSFESYCLYETLPPDGEEEEVEEESKMI
jgi:hypothetical protein